MEIPFVDMLENTVELYLLLSDEHSDRRVQNLQEMDRDRGKTKKTP